MVVTSFLIDDLNTHSEEMDRYHRSLRGLGGERRLLARRFRAEDWHQIQESHGLWGRVLV